MEPTIDDLLEAELRQKTISDDMGAFEATTTVTIDTTGALVIDFTNQFSLSDVANTITLKI